MRTVRIEIRRDRFMRNVSKQGPVMYDRLGRCWVQLNKEGKYGSHRLAYQLFVGPVERGVDVCHHCDNPRCVRPDHLFVGTRKDNMQDCAKKGRHKSVNKPESVPRGDAHFARNRPELLSRGDRHWSRVRPDRLARGDKNGSRTQPENLVRGDAHFLRQHPEVVQGEKNGRAQLTNEQAREIRALYRPYVNNHKPSNRRELATRYGVSKDIITCIAKNKTWRSVQ